MCSPPRLLLAAEEAMMLQLCLLQCFPLLAAPVAAVATQLLLKVLLLMLIR